MHYSLAQIADMLGCTRRYVEARLVTHPDFPKVVVEGDRRARRWDAVEVRCWYAVTFSPLNARH